MNNQVCNYNCKDAHCYQVDHKLPVFPGVVFLYPNDRFKALVRIVRPYHDHFFLLISLRS